MEAAKSIGATSKSAAENLLREDTNIHYGFIWKKKFEGFKIEPIVLKNRSKYNYFRTKDNVQFGPFASIIEACKSLGILNVNRKMSNSIGDAAFRNGNKFEYKWMREDKS